ncbi:MAG TPA: NUDIX domain-containing protein [Candidatus Limnocylindria bacterium]
MTELDPGAGPPDRQVTRLAAYALCTDADRILMCRIAPGPWTAVGRWTLPGGGLDFGEPPAVGAIRELEEETGLIGEVEGLADVFSWSARWLHPADGADEAFHAIQIVYRVRIVGGELRDEPDGSTDRAAWLALEELPKVPLVRLAWEGVRLAFGLELAAEPVP